MKYIAIIKLLIICVLVLQSHSEQSGSQKTIKEELDQTYQNLKGKKGLLTDLLAKVLDNKDDKDNSNPEMDQSLQEL